MEQRTVGVILRTRPLTETSLIVQWLTVDEGRVATVARGARRAKSPFRGRLDLFYEGELTFRRSRRSELHALCEVNVRETFPSLRTDWSRLTQAAYGVALIEKATESDTPLPEVWPIFRGYLAYLDRASRSPAAVVTFELKLLEALGLLPEFVAGSLPARALESAGRLLALEWSEMDDVPSDPGDLKVIAAYLRKLLILQFDRVPRGRDEALG